VSENAYFKAYNSPTVLGVRLRPDPPEEHTGFTQITGGFRGGANRLPPPLRDGLTPSLTVLYNGDTVAICIFSNS